MTAAFQWIIGILGALLVGGIGVMQIRLASTKKKLDKVQDALDTATVQVQVHKAAVAVKDELAANKEANNEQMQESQSQVAAVGEESQLSDEVKVIAGDQSDRMHSRAERLRKPGSTTKD